MSGYPKMNEHSRIGFHRLVVSKEGSTFLVGREDTEDYIQIPEVGITALRLLERHRRISDVERKLAVHYGHYDVQAFVRQLVAVGFVRYIDGQQLPDKHKHIKPTMMWMRPTYVRWMFHPLMYMLYLFIICSAAYAVAIHPSYVPSYKDFFFFPESYILFTILSFIIGWLLVVKHELAHYFAALSRGVHGRFSISNRLYFLVAETDITNMYHLPVRQRWRVYFAGIGSDLLSMGISVLLLFSHDLGAIALPALAVRLLKFIILTETLGILWQFLIFMKTDLYFAFENLFTSESLLEDARHYLKGVMLKLLGMERSKSYSDFLPHEHKSLVRTYALFLLVTIPISLVRLLVYNIPIWFNLIWGAAQKLLASPFGTLAFWDALIFLLFYCFDYGLLYYALYVKYKEHSKSPGLRTLMHVLHHERVMLMHSHQTIHDSRVTFAKDIMEASDRLQQRLSDSFKARGKRK